MKYVMRRNNITPDQAEQLAEILRTHRLQHGMSMRQLALQAGFNVSTIVKLEGGANLSPQPSTLKAVARVLGIDPGQIYTALDWLPTQPLPGLAPYMRAKYHDLPETAIAELEAYANRLIQRHGGHGSAARIGDSWSRGLAGRCGHDDLELDGGQSAERGLAASAVVGALGPGDDGETQLLAGGPAAAVEDVLL
jgi:transcriptional regulator with XRE-family HTH domain